MRSVTKGAPVYSVSGMLQSNKAVSRNWACGQPPPPGPPNLESQRAKIVLQPYLHRFAAILPVIMAVGPPAGLYTHFPAA
jgi:hypothetical protein